MGRGNGIRKSHPTGGFLILRSLEPYCVLLAVSLSFGTAGLVATEFAGLVVMAVGAGLTAGGGIGGSGVLPEGAGAVVVLLIAGWLADDGRGLRELAGTAGVAGAEGAALGFGTLLGVVEALVLAMLLAGAFVALTRSSCGGALAGLGASSTAGRASATIAGFSSAFVAGTAGDVVASATFAGGATSAIVFPARW